MTNQDTKGPKSTGNRPVYNRPEVPKRQADPALDLSKHAGQHGHKYPNIEHLEVDEDLVDETEEPPPLKDTSLMRP